MERFVAALMAVAVVPHSLLPYGSLAAGLAPQPAGELRMQGIQPQATEHTCGLAALATVLSALGQPADESMLRQLAALPPDRPATVAQLARLTRELGLHPFVARSTWEGLRRYFRQFREPVIVLLAWPSPHFSVLAGLDDQAAYLADPMWGHLALARAAFERDWSGVVLFVRPRQPLPEALPEQPLQTGAKASQRRLGGLQLRQQLGLGLPWGG